jgi:hypothetical protein
VAIEEDEELAVRRDDGLAAARLDGGDDLARGLVDGHAQPARDA